MILVLEYAPYGDLLGYLRKSRGLEDKFYSSLECCQQEVTSYDLLSFAQQIASGMNFLASKKVCLNVNLFKIMNFLSLIHVAPFFLSFSLLLFVDIIIDIKCCYWNFVWLIFFP